MSLSMHPREKIVNAAELSLLDTIIDWRRTPEAQQLTLWELVRILTTVLNNQLAIAAKYAIRQERHGNEDKPGGLE